MEFEFLNRENEIVDPIYYFIITLFESSTKKDQKNLLYLQVKHNAIN